MIFFKKILETEVDSDGGDVALLEFIVCETFEDGGFAD